MFKSIANKGDSFLFHCSNKKTSFVVDPTHCACSCPISWWPAPFPAYSKYSINAVCVQVAAKQEDMETSVLVEPSVVCLSGPIVPGKNRKFRRVAVALAFCQLPQSSSRAALSNGDWSTSEFLASRLSACCSRIFWDLARSQSVLTCSLFHTTEVSVSLTYPSSPV